MTIGQEMKDTLRSLGFEALSAVERTWCNRDLEFRISERSLLRETPASLSALIAMVRRHRGKGDIQNFTT